MIIMGRITERYQCTQCTSCFLHLMVGGQGIENLMYNNYSIVLLIS